jgi:DNA-binding transcriptional LysR family regulator
VPSTAFAEFPLILPEPDSGIRKVLEQALQREGILEKWNVVLEVGSWSTNLAYVRDGYGVGRVSDSALFNSQDLVVRYLDESLFPPIAANLICRRLPGRKEELDLSDEARALRDVLIQGAASSRS